MIEAACGVGAAWVVLHLCGVCRRWPWRIADLTSPERSGTPRSERRRGRPALPGPWDRRRSEHRLRGATSREVERDLLATIDLMRLAVTAGHTLHSAVDAVGELGEGPVATGFARVARASDRGASLVEALDALPDELGPALRPFVTSLSVAASSGAPLAPALVRLADAERRRQRRRAEERIRRLPVLLLAPLVGFVLPAFVLLTIVPVALATAGSAAVLGAPMDQPLPPPGAARAANH